MAFQILFNCIPSTPGIDGGTEVSVKLVVFGDIETNSDTFDDVYVHPMHPYGWECKEV